MSFILDALKKSESDRQRQSGPALFEVKVAAPRSALPPWAIAIAMLFVANLAVVAWLLLRHGPHPAGVAPAAAPSASAPATAAASRVAAPAATEAAGAVAPAAAAPVAAAPAPAAARAPGAAFPATTARAASPSENPDDYEPAAEQPPAVSLSHVKRGTDAGVPLYQQLAGAPGAQLPQLRLDLHAYSEKPPDRWVLINMHKLREGDALPEGVRVERITPDGAVLSYHGSQFLLTQ
jgi:general secretion pathway protein B